MINGDKNAWTIVSRNWATNWGPKNMWDHVANWWFKHDFWMKNYWLLGCIPYFQTACGAAWAPVFLGLKEACKGRWLLSPAVQSVSVLILHLIIAIWPACKTLFALPLWRRAKRSRVMQISLKSCRRQILLTDQRLCSYRWCKTPTSELHFKCTHIPEATIKFPGRKDETPCTPSGLKH